MGETGRPRIVVAEDDAAVCDLVRTQLSQAGYDVTCASDGREALASIEAVDPCGVVLDLNMPHVDGFGVLAALQRGRGRLAPPVLVLTARHAAGDVKRCLTLGAKDYLAKPFKDRDLLARVARLVRTVSVRPEPDVEDDYFAI